MNIYYPPLIALFHVFKQAAFCFSICVLVFFACGIALADASTLSSVHPKVHYEMAHKIDNSWTLPVRASDLVSNPAVEQSRSVGVRYRLLNLQHRVVEAGVDYYIQAHLQITAPAGLSRSNLEIEFDPTDQDIYFHQIGIRRDDQYIELGAYAQARLIDRERHWEEAALLLGRKTLLLLLPDVRVGDVIEYSYTLTARNPLWQNRFFLARPLNAGPAVDRYFFHVRWPQDRQIQSALPPGFAPIKKQGYWSFTFDSADQLQPEPKSHMTQAQSRQEGALRRESQVWFEFSELSSWPQLGRWISDLWAPVHEPHSPDQLYAYWRQLAEFDELGSVDPLLTQVLAAIHWVQDEVRYLGLELGMGSLMPRSAMEVLKTRYGDCKDKALLLVSLLKAMGLEAQPILVSTDTSSADYLLPMPAAFNHVIVQLNWRGQRLWIDPTRRWQGGQLLNLHATEFDRGLVLAGLESHWQSRPKVKPVNAQSTQLMLTSSSQGDLQMRLETQLRGQAADIARDQLSRYGSAWFEKNRLARLKPTYGMVRTLTPMTVSDDRQLNILNIQEHYQVALEINRDSNDSFWHFSAHTLLPIVQAMQASVALGGGMVSPQQVEQVIFLNFPKGQEPHLPNHTAFDNEAFSFEFEIDRDHPKGLSLHYRLIPKALTQGLSEVDRDRLSAALTRLKGALEYRLPKVKSVSWRDQLLQARLWQLKWLIQSYPLHWQPMFSGLSFLLAGLVGFVIGFSLQALFWSARRGRHSKHLFRPRPLVFAGCSVGTFGLYAMAWLWLVYGTAERRKKLKLWAHESLSRLPVLAMMQALIVMMVIVIAACRTQQWFILLLSGCAFLTLIPKTWHFFDWYQERQRQASLACGATQMRSGSATKGRHLAVIRVPHSSAKRQPLASEAA